jgi:hypothetical protein
MRVLALILLLWPLLAHAQTREVRPGELALSVTVEETAHTPLVREMVLITIRGEYRRHITRETLQQPDLEGFSWAQLGPDSWREERLDGRQVKIFTRHMALYPDRPGRIEIGPFTHELTLTDEGDDWFAHEVASAPISIEVAPKPDIGEDWWFPVRRLRITDEWSNAPDQLRPGEGVLRVIRLEALGVTPEMIPPMPDLASPSGLIFPHPEQRFAELSPEGPVTYAFWRWTIQPGNEVSAIVEPLRVAYFDTVSRVAREAVVSAQRVAYGDAVAPSPGSAPREREPAATLPGWRAAMLALAVFVGGVGWGLRGRWVSPAALRRRFPFLDPVARRLRAAARRRNLAETRRMAAALMLRDGASARRAALLHGLDRAAFDPAAPAFDLRQFARAFLRARHS